MLIVYFVAPSQQSISQSPSRIAPVQDHASTQSVMIAMSIIGVIVIGMLFFLGYKHYRQYCFRQKVKTLERLWQKPHHKRLR
jgi:cytochrome bd-type quinol oxidase subunit 2